MIDIIFLVPYFFSFVLYDICFVCGGEITYSDGPFYKCTTDTEDELCCCSLECYKKFISSKENLR